uniref:Uncharacterized protein n=1 Tax=Mucochytrium quahogii TaxID=96639 RepID=A0A7S2RJH4_9STRA|mmetsp:Transcript_17430/g.29785  ORF Transcript_17430/g.29785 Transcript_17430/m.29785 type:complete len:176 (+) Transcript_17430:1142-1669(+)
MLIMRSTRLAPTSRLSLVNDMGSETGRTHCKSIETRHPNQKNCSSIKDSVRLYVNVPTLLATLEGIFKRIVDFPVLEKDESGVFDLTKKLFGDNGEPNYVPIAGINKEPAQDEQQVTIGIAGDWGAGTAEANVMATFMKQRDVNWTFHLGDIYLSGKQKKSRQTCSMVYVLETKV